MVANDINAGRSRPLLNSRTSVSSASSLAKDKESAAVANLSEKINSVSSSPLPLRVLMPFVPVYDIPRGLVHATQSALEFAFMLVVMYVLLVRNSRGRNKRTNRTYSRTYQAAFILSIVVGLGIGETLFGRYNVQAHIY